MRRRFDLSAALDGAPVRTRSGKIVTNLHLRSYERIYNLWGRIGDRECAWMGNGEHRLLTSRHPLDLEIAYEKS